MSAVCKASLTTVAVFLLAAGELYAQTSSPLQATVSGSDMAAAASVTHAWYRITPASTPAGKTLPKTSLTNKNLSSVPTLPQPGFYPPDLKNHARPVITSYDHKPS